jgi:hypothetical protein
MGREKELGSRTLVAKDGMSVDFVELWKGSGASESNRKSRKGDFSGRPALADTLWPALRKLSRDWAGLTLRSHKYSLQEFFRFLDSFEELLQPVAGLQDCGELTAIFWLTPPREGLTWERPTYTHLNQTGRVLARAHRIAGTRDRFRWPVMTFEKASDKTYANDVQAREALTLLKREAQGILARWAAADRMAAAGRNLLEIEPNARRALDFEASKEDLHATYRAIIAKTGDPLPGPEKVAAELGCSTGRLPAYWFLRISDVQAGLYPTVDDLCCFACLVMARTGWNPSTVLSIDVSNDDWAVRHGDPKNDLWRLIAWKERAKAWQDTLCRGRHTTGPYFVINSLIDRAAPLRRLAKECPERFVSPASLAERSPFLAAAQKNKMGSVVALLPNGQDGLTSKWWRNARDEHNKSVDEASRMLLAQAMKTREEGSENAGPCAPVRVKIPEDMIPSDWRDLYASFVFVDSRYSWLMVQWALGHKRLSSTRHYLRSRLWRKFGEERLAAVQDLMVSQLEDGELNYPVMRAKLEFGHEASPEDLARLKAFRDGRKSNAPTPSGYDCTTPFNPPRELDPGNPSDGSMRARCGDRCPGCPCAIAFDPSAMAKRLVRLRLIRSEISLAAWHESQFSSDIECLEKDLLQWPEKTVRDLIDHWQRAFDTGEERLNPWAGLN